MAAGGRAVGRDGKAAATAEAPSGLPQPACSGPHGDGRDLLRAADGMPVERAAADNPVLVLVGAPALSGMDRSGRVRGVPARRAPGLRGAGRHRLDTAATGRSDGKSTVGWEKTGPNPTGRGKRGTKRSVLIDGRGVPLGVVIDGANRNDHKLMRQTLQAIPVERPQPTPRDPQRLCLDKGFDYDEPGALDREFGFTLHLRTRGEAADARRRVV